MLQHITPYLASTSSAHATARASSTNRCSSGTVPGSRPDMGSAGMEIQPLAPEHHAAAYRVATAADPFMWSSWDSWVSRLDLADRHMLVAVEDGTVIGVASWFDREVSGARVWVDPVHQQQGVGRTLARYVEERQAGRRSKCLLYSAEPRSIAFARQRGFVVEEFRGDAAIVDFVAELPVQVAAPVLPPGYELGPLPAPSALWDLARAFKAERTEDEGVPVASTHEFAEFCAGLNADSSLGLRDDTGALVGFTFVRGEGSVANTMATFIDPASRGRGLARPLKIASLRASSAWASWTHTECWRNNTPIYELNRRLGLREAQWLQADRPGVSMP